VLKAGKFQASRCTLAMIAAAAMQIGLPSARAMTAEAAEQSQQAVARSVNLSASRPGGALKLLRSPLPPNTRVHVVSRQSAPGSRSVLLRLACDDSRDCLPFYAVIEGTTHASAAQAVSFARPSFAPAAKPLLRLGDRVEIVEQLSGLHLRARGVCLQPGSIGNRIRVRTLTTHRVLLATVAAPALVKVEQ
jgi:flagellar basal body P-ring formation chaperone FlgA